MPVKHGEGDISSGNVHSLTGTDVHPRSGRGLDAAPEAAIVQRIRAFFAFLNIYVDVFYVYGAAGAVIIWRVVGFVARGAGIRVPAHAILYR